MFLPLPLPLPSLQVIKMDDCIGAAVEARIASMGNGDVMLLENVRFHAGEEVRGPTSRRWMLTSVVEYNRSLSSGSKVEGADSLDPLARMDARSMYTERLFARVSRGWRCLIQHGRVTTLPLATCSVSKNTT